MVWPLEEQRMPFSGWLVLSLMGWDLQDQDVIIPAFFGCAKLLRCWHWNQLAAGPWQALADMLHVFMESNLYLAAWLHWYIGYNMKICKNDLYWDYWQVTLPTGYQPVNIVNISIRHLGSFLTTAVGWTKTASLMGLLQSDNGSAKTLRKRPLQLNAMNKPLILVILVETECLSSEICEMQLHWVVSCSSLCTHWDSQDDMKHDSARQDRIHAHFARFGEVQAQVKGMGAITIQHSKFWRTSMKCPQNVEIKRQCGGLDGVPSADFTRILWRQQWAFHGFQNVFNASHLSFFMIPKFRYMIQFHSKFQTQFLNVF